MAGREIRVRPVDAEDRTAWLALWAQYCAFYHAEVSQHATDATWSRIVASDGSVRGIVVADADSDAPLGFAHYVLHPFTWGDGLACYLEDLFVEPAMRGAGAGRAMLEHLCELGRIHGWARVYWHTQAGNLVARRLYDRFVRADDFVRYTITLGNAPAPRL